MLLCIYRLLKAHTFATGREMSSGVRWWSNRSHSLGWMLTEQTVNLYEVLSAPSSCYLNLKRPFWLLNLSCFSSMWYHGFFSHLKNKISKASFPYFRVQFHGKPCAFVSAANYADKKCWHYSGSYCGAHDDDFMQAVVTVGITVSMTNIQTLIIHSDF